MPHRRPRLVLTGGLLLAAGTAAAHARQPAAPPPVAIVDVTVVPMTADTLLPHRTVLLRGDRVEHVDPAATARIPAGAVRIDGRGRFLMPGLAEMHGHLPTPAEGDTMAARVLAMFVANGVTTVRGMLGHPYQLALRERVRGGSVVGPTLYLSGPALTGNSAPTPDSARRAVAAQHAAGYDLVKMHEGLSRASYDAAAAAAAELRFPFAGHVAADVGLPRALEARQSSVEHLLTLVTAIADEAGVQAMGSPAEVVRARFSAVTPERAASLARRIAAAGVAVTPTTVLWETRATRIDALRARPELRHAPPLWVSRWTQAKAQPGNDFDAATSDVVVAAQRTLLRALRDARVSLLLGSDAPQTFNVPGFSLHRELEALQQAGLRPYDILLGGTRGGAEYLRAAGVAGADFGTVTPGARADLLLLEADPLADVRNAARRVGVVLRGRWLPAAALDSLLAHAGR
jgi:imidazolonepropionase-like amidohydrolase